MRLVLQASAIGLLCGAAAPTQSRAVICCPYLASSVLLAVQSVVTSFPFHYTRRAQVPAAHYVPSSPVAPPYPTMSSSPDAPCSLEASPD